MTVLLTTTVMLTLWVIAWAVGVKAFDALMLVIVVVLLSAGWGMLKPYLPGYREDPDDPGSGGAWNAR